MAYLKIHDELVTDEVAQQLQKLCPFGAFQYENNKLEITSACKMCKICVKKGPAGVVEYVEEKVEEIDKSKWKGIAVFVEHSEDGIHPVTFELIGKAKELAGVIGHEVYVLIIGYQVEEKVKELLHYGVSKVYSYDYKELEHFRIIPYANAFEDFIRKVQPSSIMVGATNLGRSLAPRVAARFRTGLTADCTILQMKENTDLVQIRPAFGGNIMAQIVTPNHRPQFCTVRYKIFDAAKRQDKPSGEAISMVLDESKLQSSTEVLEIRKGIKEMDISEADIIIAVGRGVKTQADLDMVDKLAEALKAKVACTRPLIESGWFDAKRQIGLSGRTVKPKLIITIGISGAVQFTAGMNNSDCVIAINKDKNAPIFDVAHYGIVGDFYEVIPELLDKIS